MGHSLLPLPAPFLPSYHSHQRPLRRSEAVVLAAVAHLLLLVRVDHVRVTAPGERALAGAHQVPHADLARAASAAVVEDITGVFVNPGSSVLCVYVVS